MWGVYDKHLNRITIIVASLTDYIIASYFKKSWQTPVKTLIYSRNMYIVRGALHINKVILFIGYVKKIEC